MSAVQILQRHLGARQLGTAVILGTGLGDAVQPGPDDIVLAYSDLPGFPKTQVSGHAGRLVLRPQGQRMSAFLLGRAHYYETGKADAMAGALSALAACGARELIVTCASGSTRPEIAPGSLVLIRDHINVSGTNPLIGMQGDARFVSMVDAYDPALSARLNRAAQDVGLPLKEGVYMWFSGPSFETPAEVRMAALLGADLVGMSTVPEVIVARHLGLRVAGLSLVTNHGAGLAGGMPTHLETQRMAHKTAEPMGKILAAFLAQDAS